MPFPFSNSPNSSENIKSSLSFHFKFYPQIPRTIFTLPLFHSHSLSLFYSSSSPLPFQSIPPSLLIQYKVPCSPQQPKRQNKTKSVVNKIIIIILLSLSLLLALNSFSNLSFYFTLTHLSLSSHPSTKYV